VARPKVLFLDEPTTGLDPQSRADVWAMIDHLVAQGTSVLLTTQYLEEADALADRIMLIDHGKEIAKGTPSELKALVGDQRVDVVAVDSQGFEQLKQELGWQGLELTLNPEQRRISVPAPDEVADLNRVAQAVAATRIAVDEIALRRPTLDDAFITLTGHPAEEAKTEQEVAA
jgi:ABC-type multidrug transport system ATPase subunit